MDWSSPDMLQRIHSACKKLEEDNETLKSSEIFGETREGLLVRATFQDDTKPYLKRVERLEVKNHD